MRLQLEGAVEPKDVVKFKLEQDGNEVNILANGVLVGYFFSSSEKISLELIYLGSDTENFNKDKDSFLDVRK